MKDEALRLALEALEMYELETNSEFQRKAITAIKAALEAKDELVCVCGAVWEGQELVIAPKEKAKDEIDWRDMYEKQKRHTEMWVAKYEKDIGPLEKAVPQQEAKDEKQEPNKFDLMNESFEREEANQARVREFMRNH